MQITIEVPDSISKETVLQQIAGLEKKLRILKVRQERQEKKATGGNMLKNMQWLQNHAAAYRGKWVALKNGKLMGSHEKTGGIIPESQTIRKYSRLNVFSC